jgi:hypothetical protein
MVVNRRLCKISANKEVWCVVYEATVKQIPSGKTETYTKVTARTLKQRLYEQTPGRKAAE